MKSVDFLLINPWIYDFSAHDFWLRPYGLLKLAGRLRAEGYSVFLMDLLEPFHPELPKAPKRSPNGTGHFYKEPIAKPSFFLDVPRRFFRYGIPYSLFLKEIESIKFKAVMITCTMTYWYPGLLSVLDFISRRFPEIPVYIGGIYATLCRDHLERFLTQYYSHIDWEVVVEELSSFLKRLRSRFTPSSSPYPNDYPAFDLQRRIPYVVLMTSEGCPLSCPYCASKILYPTFKQRNPHEVVEEIIYWHTTFGVTEFAFYDDALLINFEKHLALILESLLLKGIKVHFHTPNALHARLITKERAKLLKRAGFVTIRLGLERIENRVDQKVTLEEFESAVNSLFEAGFSSENLGAYILFGLPDEDFEVIRKTILYAGKLKIPPYLAEFSPIPGTPLFEMARKTSRYPLEEEPLCHNKSVFPALKKPDWEQIHEIKNLAKQVRRDLLR